MCETPSGNRYVVVATCYSTKNIEAAPLKDKKAESICGFLLELIGRNTVPKYIITDRGMELVVRGLQSVCTERCYALKE